jgi:putative salt-induced outer membrane protein
MKKMMLVLGVVCALAGAPLFAEEAETDEEEQEPTWKGSLGLAWVATSGNTDTSSVGLDFGLERKPEPWGLTFVARGNRAEDSGDKTAENFLVSARAVRSLGKRWEAFGGLAWARDPFAGYDSQTLASAGATYKAVESDRHILSFDGGLTYTWEDQISPVAPAPTLVTDSISFAGGLVGLSWDWQIGKNSKLTERLVYLPNFDDSGDWRLNSMTAIEADINEWLALRFGYDIRHRNQPIGDAEKTDTTSTASVVFNF